MRALSDRLRHVRVCCGDWTRVMGEAVLFPVSRASKGNRVAVVLDPPYADAADRTEDLYACDSSTVAHDVREWAIAHGDDPRCRIVLCGYEGEHSMPVGWECVAGKAGQGYGYLCRCYANAGRERLWFSPACLRPADRMPLFRHLARDEL